MYAKDLQRYKRLLLAKLDELSATRGGDEALVPGAGGWQGDLVDQANSDAEAPGGADLRRQSIEEFRRFILIFPGLGWKMDSGEEQHGKSGHKEDRT